MENRANNEEIVNDIINQSNIDDHSTNCLTKKEEDNFQSITKVDDAVPSSTNAITEDIIPDNGIQKPMALIEDIDDDTLQDLENVMTENDKEKNKQDALDLKDKGNKEFKFGNYFESINFYTKALNTCPISCAAERSIFYCNRAAAKMKLNYNETAIEDCTKAIELNPYYVKAYLRRAKLHEGNDKLDESLKDYMKILELDPANNEAKAAYMRLEPIINERNEKLKGEMLGKLKDLGNLVLRPFGLSTDDFKLQEDPTTGGYSINFQQNQKS